MNRRLLQSFVLTFITFQLTVTLVLAQGGFVGVYPGVMTYQNIDRRLMNPIGMEDKAKNEVLLIAQNRLGVYSDIRQVYALGQYVLTEGNSTQLIRVILSNEKEGKYISTPRAYLNYGVSLPLNEIWELGVGVNLGGVNPTYNTPKKTTSAMLLDGDVGLAFSYRRQFKIGGAFRQLFDGESSVFSGYYLKRYYTFFTTYKLEGLVNWNMSFTGVVYTDIPNQYQFSVGAEQKGIELGVIYKYLIGESIYGGVHFEGEYPLSVVLLYNSDLIANRNSLGPSIELSLNCTFGERTK